MLWHERLLFNGVSKLIQSLMGRAHHGLRTFDRDVYVWIAVWAQAYWDASAEERPEILRIAFTGGEYGDLVSMGFLKRFPEWDPLFRPAVGLHTVLEVRLTPAALPDRPLIKRSEVQEDFYQDGVRNQEVGRCR